MIRYNHKKGLSKKGIFYRTMVVLSTLALVVYFLPREGQTHLQFDLDKPWRYNQLIATFDFPIYKSEKAIEKELNELYKQYEPYYELNTETKSEQIKRFKDDVQTQFKGTLPNHYVDYIEKQLKYVYEQGIVNNESFNRLSTDSVHAVRLYSGNESIGRQTEHIFSQKSAYSYIIDQADTTRINTYKLKQCNLNKYITPNLTFDAAKSEAARKELEGSLSYAKGMVVAGQKIIDRGEIVTEETYDILLSYEKEIAKAKTGSTQTIVLILGQILYVGSLIICLLLYFNLFRRDYLENPRSTLLLTTLSAIFPLLTAFLVRNDLLNVYVLPYGILPIFVRVFMDSRTAFVTHVITIMVCAISLKYPFEFIATQTVGGLAAIYSLRELSQRSQLLKTALIVTLSSMLCYLSIELIHGHSLQNLYWGTYMYMFINGVLLLFAYPLMFLIEKIFGFTSNVTLVELSNINNEILRRMSEVAPGTFQHSMQVANLAAEVANRIGAKSQLVRTGALYHDIGKTMNPVFFTENQSGNNPHSKLSFERSARIVINHVKDGIMLAEKYNLPKIIKDFITTHHGSGMAKYFYISSKNANPDKEIDAEPYTYPGPNPSTIEQAILMMTDSVEAASRSLPEYTEESINDLVDRIINGQVQEGFFKECPITFLDIHTAKEVLKEKLKTIYHTRVSYPELKE